MTVILLLEIVFLNCFFSSLIEDNLLERVTLEWNFVFFCYVKFSVLSTLCQNQSEHEHDRCRLGCVSCQVTRFCFKAMAMSLADGKLSFAFEHEASSF